MVFSIFGRPKGCKCRAPRDHQSGQCPDGCLCELCSCTCGWACSLGGPIDQKYGGCRCGCLHHHKA